MILGTHPAVPVPIPSAALTRADLSPVAATLPVTASPLRAVPAFDWLRRPGTYGDLLTIVAAHLSCADRCLADAAPTDHGDAVTMPAPGGARLDRLGARAELLAYRELLHALRVHTGRLFGTRHRADAVRRAPAPDRVHVITVRLVDALAAAVHTRPQHGHVAAPGSLAAQWLEAARAVRAATDLVATHQDARTGAWRTLHSHHLDAPAVRVAGVARIAALTSSTAAAEFTLQARARAAGLRWTEVSRPLPDLTAIHATATALAAWPTDPDAAAWLNSLTVARPGVRTTNLLTELHDRLTRLHDTAWDRRDDATASLACLATTAATAGAWHRQAAAHSSLDGHDAHAVIATAAAWDDVGARLATLATLTRPDPDAPDHARTIAGLLGTLDDTNARPGGGTSVGDPAVSEWSTRTGEVLSAGLTTFAKIADYDGDTLRQLKARGRLWAPASVATVTLSQASGGRVIARLPRTWALASPAHVSALLDAYGRAAATGGPNQPRT